MTDSDYSAIRPVEGLQTIQGMTSIQRRQEQQQRQQNRSEKHDTPESEPEEDPETPTPKADRDDPHSIDYCA